MGMDPKYIFFPVHGTSIITCLLFSSNRIITALDDQTIRIHNPLTGELEKTLVGHESGIWALETTKDFLASGSSDNTLRIWDLTTGHCKHVFGGRTDTVHCLAIVKPEMIEMEDDGVVRREEWPKRPLIVTGSRDHSLRVWKLPSPADPEYKYNTNSSDDYNFNDNPYHIAHLQGHDHAVRALDFRGQTLISGSFDCTLRVWDIIDSRCKWVLTGHTQKIYSVVLDPTRNQAYSGSMDTTIRVWNLSNGQCAHTLTGHTSLVGLIRLSPSYLVSASADSTLKIWNPDTGELKQTISGHAGAITCFEHDEFKVVSGSDGSLKMWDIRDGTLIRSLLIGSMGLWQVVFQGRWCVAASSREDRATFLDVWDFGQEGIEDPFGWQDGDEEEKGEDISERKSAEVVRGA